MLPHFENIAHFLLSQFIICYFYCPYLHPYIKINLASSIGYGNAAQHYNLHASWWMKVIKLPLMVKSKMGDVSPYGVPGSTITWWVHNRKNLPLSSLKGKWIEEK